jgi:osmotically-inducible protein OsmY
MPVEVEQEAPLVRHIAAVAEARLGASPHRALRTILCKCDEGVLVLRGRLSTYFHKQLAQEIVADIEGVEQVVNQIEVAVRAT